MKKKDVDRTELGKNPFLNDFQIPIRRIKTKDTGEDGIPVFGHYDLELQEKTSLYIDKEFRKSLCGLSGTASQIMLWVMQKIENGEDYIWIKRETCMKELEIKSANTYRSAIRKLCANNVLGAIYGVPDVFWTNPKIYFKGSRHKVFPDKVDLYESSTWKLKQNSEIETEE